MVVTQFLPRVGFETTTCWSQVQRSTCCATAPPPVITTLMIIPRRAAMCLWTHCNIGWKRAFPTGVLDRWHNCLRMYWRNVAQRATPISVCLLLRHDSAKRRWQSPTLIATKPYVPHQNSLTKGTSLGCRLVRENFSTVNACAHTDSRLYFINAHDRCRISGRQSALCRWRKISKTCFGILRRNSLGDFL